MINLSGIIATSLLVCSLAGPAWAGLSETSGVGEGSSEQGLSMPGSDGGQAVIDSLLDRFAGIGFSDPFSGESCNPSIPIVHPISETSILSAFTRASSPMNAYYSRSGTDNKQTIADLSRLAAFVTAANGERFASTDAGLAAIVQGHFVGSGVVVDGANIAPIQIASSEPAVIQTNGNTIQTNSNIVPATASVPLPLPFFLTGSGLIALLSLRKKSGNSG